MYKDMNYRLMMSSGKHFIYRRDQHKYNERIFIEYISNVLKQHSDIVNQCKLA